MAARPEAIVEPTRWMQRSVTTGDLVIPSRIGRRTFLTDLFVSGLAAEQYLDIYIGTRWMLRLYPTTLDSILVDTPVETPEGLGCLSRLKRDIPGWVDLYAAHDEDITIRASAAYTSLMAYFRREEVPAPGVKTDPGGSQCMVRNYIYWLSHSATITADGVNQPFDLALMPVGARTLVDNEQVKGTEQFDLVAIVLGNEVNSTDTHLDRVKMIDEGVMIGTPETQDGFLVDPNSGNELQMDVLHGRMFKLPEIYLLGKGHRYRFLYDVDHITSSRAAGHYKLGFIGVHRQLG